MATVKKKFTITGRVYLAQGKTGTTNGSNHTIHFGNVIPEGATYVSSTISVSHSSISASDNYACVYSYITDGSNPSSGSGYTYRYSLNTAGLGQFIQAYGIRKDMGIYMSFKNNSTYYDISVNYKVSITITYTSDEPSPEPLNTRDDNLGDCRIVRGNTIEPVFASLYNGKRWQAINETQNLFYENGLPMINTIATSYHNTQYHLTYKMFKEHTVPVLGANLTALQGTISNQIYNEIEQCIEFDIETSNVLFKIKTNNRNSSDGFFIYSDMVYNFSRTGTCEIYKKYNGSNVILKTVDGASFGSEMFGIDETDDRFLYFRATGLIPGSHHKLKYATIPVVEFATQAQGVNIISFATNPETISKLNFNLPEPLINKVPGHYFPANVWTAVRYTVLVAGGVAQLTTSTSGTNLFYAPMSFTQGHKYLFYYDAKASQAIDGTSANAGIFLPAGFTSSLYSKNLSTDWKTISVCATCQQTSVSTYFHPYSFRTAPTTAGIVIKLKRVNVIDLTEAGLADTVNSYADFQALFGDVHTLYA